MLPALLCVGEKRADEGIRPYGKRTGCGALCFVMRRAE